MLSYITALDQPSSHVRTSRDCASAGAQRTLSIFGSTGSIGASALNIVRARPDKFKIAALAGGGNVALLAAQAGEFRPAYLAVKDEASAKALRPLLAAGYSPEIFIGQEGFSELATVPEPEILLLAQSGAAGLNATLAAARTGKTLALANKESLVLAGSLIRRICRENGTVILPVDSEHNAIFQVSHAEPGKGIRQIWLTASGGPFRGFTSAQLDKVDTRQALSHPKWSMGAKISIDSATMMNKGLEIIEAAHLFGLPADDIRVLVHPQSIVHSMVEFVDGSVLAQLGCPDMRIPISYCLGWPERLEAQQPRLNLLEHPQLTFEQPDHNIFPCLNLAREAMRSGPWQPIVLNAANEVAVELFLQERISFPQIAVLVEKALGSNLAQSYIDNDLNLPNILALDQETRLFLN